MTTAKFLTAPAQGHGLTDKVTDPIYRALARNEPTDTFVALVVLRPKSFGASDTADGRHQHVSFEVARCEPVSDANQANELRYLVQALYEQRTSTGGQRTLPLGLGSNEERRQEVMERLEDWATTTGKIGAELETTWREHFGIGPDSDWSFGDQGVPGDYRKASLAHLLSFGYESGALKMPEDDDAAGSAASDEGEEPDTAQVSDGACQVCSKDAPRLTDGLCDACAKNAGLPVPGATADDTGPAEATA